MMEPLKLTVMGVAGAGKSSVGLAAAKALAATYVEGDDLHPQENIIRMSKGIALTDDDRIPWLRRVGKAFADSGRPTIVGCSALKRKYRDLIRETAGDKILFLFLNGERAVIEERMKRRHGHFMPVSLLDSQFADLEPPEEDEAVLVVDIDQPFEVIVEEVLVKLDSLSPTNPQSRLMESPTLILDE